MGFYKTGNCLNSYGKLRTEWDNLILGALCFVFPVAIFYKAFFINSCYSLVVDLTYFCLYSFVFFLSYSISIIFILVRIVKGLSYEFFLLIFVVDIFFFLSSRVLLLTDIVKTCLLLGVVCLLLINGWVMHLFICLRGVIVNNSEFFFFPRLLELRLDFRPALWRLSYRYF